MTAVDDAELAALRAIADRARNLARLYQLHTGVTWDTTTPQVAYKHGQAFAARYILGEPCVSVDPELGDHRSVEPNDVVQPWPKP